MKNNTRPRLPSTDPARLAALGLRLKLAVLAAAVTLIIPTVSVASASGPVESQNVLPADVRGTYRLDDGSHLMLWGQRRHPSYELGGTHVMLLAAGEDRYVAMDDRQEVLTVERDGSGTVTAVRIDKAGQPTVTAVRDPLFHEQDARFSSPTADLAGTLLLPNGPGPHPAVAIVHGAERATRETYRLLASHFARRGVAALIYDKRGTGSSTGSAATATFNDLADDAIAAVGSLKAHPRIDTRRIGLAGFSQGGWIVATAAQRSTDVGFVVAISASGFSPADQQAWLHGNMLAVRGMTGASLAASDRLDRMMYSSLDLVAAGLMPSMPDVPGFWFHALDPYLDAGKLWAGVRQPVFALWGELDCQVPARDTARILESALQRAGNSAYTFVVLPGADHSLTLVGPCEHEVGSGHGRMRYADGYLSLPAKWIADHAAGVSQEPFVDLPPASADPELAWRMTPPAPAPWFGSFAAQAGAIVALLVVFVLAACIWLARVVMALARRRWSYDGGGAFAAGGTLAGLSAVVIGTAALVELLVLGDTFVAPLLADPLVAGDPPLYTAARLLVLATLGLTLAALALGWRGRTARPALPRMTGLLAISTVLLVSWAGYWGMVPGL